MLLSLVYFATRCLLQALRSQVVPTSIGKSNCWSFDISSR
jgi:hypothetical protein